MLNISRWTGQGGSYRLCKGFSTLLSLGLRFAGRFFILSLIVKVTILVRRSGLPKAGKSTYGLSRFFSSSAKRPVCVFKRILKVSVDRKRSYPMVMEQIVVARHCQIKVFVFRTSG